MMTATGMLELTDHTPVGMAASDGTFVLTMQARDVRAGGGALWGLTWSGPQAQIFWQAHHQALQTGTRLHVACNRVWSFGYKETGRTRIQATVIEMSVLGTEKHPIQNAALAGVLPAFYKQNQ
jgi:hypothetical protein